MNQSIDDLPIEILVKIIGNLNQSHIADYLPLRLVSSKWNYAINCHFKSIKHLVQRKLMREDRCEVTKDGLIACKTSKLLDQIISCMKLLPNLTAVSVDLVKYTKADQASLFNYLNTRPTITSLELVFRNKTKLQNDVKLENIRNFALNSHSILSKRAIKILFQADHKLTQLYVNTHVDTEAQFEDAVLILERMPTLKRFSQHIYLDDCNFNGADDGTDLSIYIKKPRLSFENLESYSFHADDVRFLNYVDNFVACCPNLKSIDCFLTGGCGHEFSMLGNLRAHTNVENLVIQGIDSWGFILKVLKMFPMVKNLALKNMKGIGHKQLSRALLKLPNLSLLYLQCSNYDCYEDSVCTALQKAYISKFGRNLQIVRRNGYRMWTDFSFRHGLNFVEKNFWPDWSARLLTD